MYLFIQTLHVCIYVCKINIATENLLLKQLKLVKSYTSPRHGFSAFCRHNSQCHSMLMSVASNGARCGKRGKGRAGIWAGQFFEKNLGSFKKSVRCGEGYGTGKRTFFWRRYIFEFLFFHSHVNFRGCMYNYIMWVCLIWTHFMLQEGLDFWFHEKDWCFTTGLLGRRLPCQHQPRRQSAAFEASGHRRWGTDSEISETFSQVCRSFKCQTLKMSFCVWLFWGRCSREFNSSYVLRLFSKVQGALPKKRVTKKYVLYIFGMKVAMEEQVSVVFCVSFLVARLTLVGHWKKKANSKQSWSKLFFCFNMEIMQLYVVLCQASCVPFFVGAYLRELSHQDEGYVVVDVFDHGPFAEIDIWWNHWRLHDFKKYDVHTLHDFKHIAWLNTNDYQKKAIVDINIGFSKAKPMSLESLFIWLWLNIIECLQQSFNTKKHDLNFVLPKWAPPLLLSQLTISLR